MVSTDQSVPAASQDPPGQPRLGRRSVLGLGAADGFGTVTSFQRQLWAPQIGCHLSVQKTQAAFAALCGASPIQASSGKVTRHRLSRGGDRAANSALYRIALVRMAGDQHTK